MGQDTKISKEDMDNLVAVFSLLLKWDRKQNPHLYKKSPEISYEYVESKDGNRNVDKAFDILFEEVEKTAKKE